jgi:hypothetical protein
MAFRDGFTLRGPAEIKHCSLQVEDRDEPDLSLRLNEGLQESPDSEIKTMTADETIYHSAKSFEDLPISAELLQVTCNRIKHTLTPPSTSCELACNKIVLQQSKWGTFKMVWHIAACKTTPLH